MGYTKSKVLKKSFESLKSVTKLIRNAARWNNRDDLANHKFLLKVHSFQSRTTLVNLFVKIAESH